MSRHLKVNLGNYESYDFGATATLGHGDLGYSDEAWAAAVDNNPEACQLLLDGLQALAERALDQLLIADIQSAQGITEEHRSVVLRSFTTTATEPASTTPRSARGKTTDQPPKRTTRAAARSRTSSGSGYQASGYP